MLRKDLRGNNIVKTIWMYNYVCNMDALAFDWYLMVGNVGSSLTMGHKLSWKGISIISELQEVQVPKKLSKDEWLIPIDS